MKVIKSSGTSQEFTPEKLIKVLEWGCENTRVDPYELYQAIVPHLQDGMTTYDIQRAATKVAASMISIEEPDYQYVASNLAMFNLRKQVYGQFEPRSFIDQISFGVNHNKYDKEVLAKWSAEEIALLESKIVHDRDFEMTYAGTMQLIEKYLVKDRSTGQIIETPQFAFMLIGMTLHQDDGENRLVNTIRFYDAVSTKKISLPTPIMAGARTDRKSVV